MRRLDWFLAAVIGASLVAFVAAYALSQAMVDAAGGGAASRQSFVQRIVSPSGEAISVQRPQRAWRGVLGVRPGVTVQLSLGAAPGDALAAIARSAASRVMP